MREIKISELSIGDWVMNLYSNSPCRVNGLRVMFQDTYEIIAVSDDTQYMLIEDNKELHNFEPIPLTPEILEKNGFVKSSECCWSNPSIECACLRYGTKYWDIRISGRNRAYRPTRISIDNILHTHQLQHALRLAGVQKGIEVCIDILTEEE